MPRSTIDKILLGSIGLLIVALVGVVHDAVRDRVVGVGDDAPHFSVRTENGLTVTPTQFGGKLLVLNFWASWCPPCMQEMPSLEQFSRSMRDQGVVVLGVSVDEDAEAYRSVIQKDGITFLTARDPTAGIADQFGTYRYPESYIINAKGEVVQKVIGWTEWTDERMLTYVRSLL